MFVNCKRLTVWHDWQFYPSFSHTYYLLYIIPYFISYFILTLNQPTKESVLATVRQPTSSPMRFGVLRHTGFITRCSFTVSDIATKHSQMYITYTYQNHRYMLSQGSELTTTQWGATVPHCVTTAFIIISRAVIISVILMCFRKYSSITWWIVESFLSDKNLDLRYETTIIYLLSQGIAWQRLVRTWPKIELVVYRLLLADSKTFKEVHLC